MFRAALITALFLALSGCARPGGAVSTAAKDGTPPGPVRQCFQTSRVANFTVDRQTAYLRVGRDTVYELSASGACPDLAAAHGVALVSVDGGSTLCVGDMASLVAPGAMPQPALCRTRVNRQLTADQIAGLAERLRP